MERMRPDPGLSTKTKPEVVLGACALKATTTLDRPSDREHSGGNHDIAALVGEREVLTVTRLRQGTQID